MSTVFIFYFWQRGGAQAVYSFTSLFLSFPSSFLPNTESQTQQQFKLESDIEIIQSVFYVYTRFLESGKFDNGLFIIAIETENVIE